MKNSIMPMSLRILMIVVLNFIFSLFVIQVSAARDLTIYPCHSYSESCGKLPPPPVKEVKWGGELGDPEKGREIAFATPLGNCLACHEMVGGTQPGEIGPSLVGYGKRGMPLAYTYQRIYDTRLYNPNAHMPIFGTNNILTDQQIRDVMAFLYSQ
jgi:sulfur-oxidizing protein SoxX